MKGDFTLKNLSKVISLGLIFSLLLTTFSFSSSKASAESDQAYTEEDVEELANLLEVLFEEGIVYDYSGSPIGFNKEVLDEKVLTTEYSYLINEFEEEGLIIDTSAQEKRFSETLVINEIELARSKRDKFLDQCVAKKLNDSYGIAAATGIVKAIRGKQYTKAAKKILALGVKGTIPGIIGTLGWILGSCIYEADKKGL